MGTPEARTPVRFTEKQDVAEVDIQTMTYEAAVAQPVRIWTFKDSTGAITTIPVATTTRRPVNG
jgi:hypothetical protein